MKSIAILMLTLSAASGAQAHVRAAETDSKITVCLENRMALPSQVNDLATGMASTMFAEIGVIVHWRSVDTCPSSAIRVKYVSQSRNEFSSEAMAFARPGEDYIEVFWDRISRNSRELWQPLLAHVLVHEITHVLEGIPRHSQSGVMKAHWDIIDLQKLAFKPLPFAPEDVDLIYAGLDYRARVARYRLVSAASAAAPLVPVSSR